MDREEARRRLAEAHALRAEPVRDLLEDGEQVLDTGPVTWLDLTENAGLVGAGEGILLATDRRVLFYSEEPQSPQVSGAGPGAPGPPPTNPAPADVLEALGASDLGGRAFRHWPYSSVKRSKLRRTTVQGVRMRQLLLETADGSASQFVGGSMFLKDLRRRIKRGG